ncbi:MAG: hypothetical protein MJZ57_05955 [Bacteroidales bacterium]|nr:hypothetical protein [Bacteroidales bacterium]
MKKIFCLILFIGALIGSSMAQPRAIGGRIGYNLEFSYQHHFASRNMVDLSVGATNIWNRWAYAEANCMFDWVFNIHNGWNWYVGPGFGLGLGYGRNWRDFGYVPFRLNLGGQLGIEYQFRIPLNLSLDWRPMVNVVGINHRGENVPNYNPLYDGIYSFAIGVRYRF